MNVSTIITKAYGNWTLGQRGKNKPNSKPIQTQSKPISETPKMNVTSFFTKDYRNELARAAGTNKPKQTQFQNRQNERNLLYYKSLRQRTTNYEQRTIIETNPIKPNSAEGISRAKMAWLPVIIEAVPWGAVWAYLHRRVLSFGDYRWAVNCCAVLRACLPCTEGLPGGCYSLILRQSCIQQQLVWLHWPFDQP